MIGGVCVVCDIVNCVGWGGPMWLNGHVGGRASSLRNIVRHLGSNFFAICRLHCCGRGLIAIMKA